MRRLGAALVLALVLLGAAPAAEAGIIRAIQYLVAGVFEIPRSALVGTVNGPPILGTAVGVLGGTARTLGYALGGTLELAGTVIPLAKKAAPFVLPFVL